MSKTKIIALAILLIGLIGFSLYLNRDYFRTEGIQITHRFSPWMRDKRPNARANDLGVPVTFMLNGFYKLTSVRVFESTKIETNKYAVPVWRIISDSNSVPTSSFNYGSYIKGMHPEAKGSRPEALQPGVTYRLMVATDKNIEAQHDFTITSSQ
ncbi:MAG: hypothetical protein QM813_23635 [Verrucomicrobiota bacterium]